MDATLPPQDLSELARNVRVLQDRQELWDLVSHYGRAVDDRDLDLVARLFTADAVFESRGGPVVGREAVLDYYRTFLATYTVTYHYAHSQTVEFVDEATATGIVQAHAELAIDGVGLLTALRYHDEYRHEDGAWRFHSRRSQQLYALPMDQLATALGAADRKRWPGTEPTAADIPESLDTYRAFFGAD